MSKMSHQHTHLSPKCKKGSSFHQIECWNSWIWKVVIEITHRHWKTHIMEITHQHKHTHTHTIPCFTIYCTVIVCKWYLHHGVVCFLMVLASPISSGSGSKPFPHSLLELEIKQAGTINLSTSCARSVTVGNKSVWIVQELNVQLPPTYMNNKDSIWHNSTVRKLVQIHLVSRNVLDWKNENTMVVCPSRSGLWQQPIKFVSADGLAMMTKHLQKIQLSFLPWLMLL